MAAIILAYFAWLFTMSRILVAGLEVMGEGFWLRLLWTMGGSLVAHLLPVLLLIRWAKRQNRTQ